jgi:hypothetical protein
MTKIIRYINAIVWIDFFHDRISHKITIESPLIHTAWRSNLIEQQHNAQRNADEKILKTWIMNNAQIPKCAQYKLLPTINIYLETPH